MATDKLKDKIHEVYAKAKTRNQAERYSYERNWLTNCLFFLGIQWIHYDVHTRKFRPKNIKPWVPRPVTNKFASIANTIMQVLSAKAPATRARPATDNPEDIAAADVADRVFSVIMKEMNEKEARSIAAAWLTLTGNVILHTCYDKDPGNGTTFVQHFKCQSCGKVFPPDAAAEVSAPKLTAESGSGRTNGGVGPPIPLPVGAPAEFPSEEPAATDAVMCPKCGLPAMPASDEAGEPVGEDMPRGKMRLDAISPFEVFVDLEARSMDEVQELLIRRRFPIEVIRGRYGKPNLEPDSSTNSGGVIGLNLLRAIAHATGSTLGGGRGADEEQNITVDMLWKRPCTDFPKGLVAIFANETLLNDGVGTDEDAKDGLPYTDRDGVPIWPFRHIVFDRVPGRFFGRTPMDDVAPKQEQRNRLESLIELIIKRCANPVWLTAKGLGITQITGEPGQILEGNWGMDPKLMPQRVSGENVPTSVIAWLEKIDNDMEEVAGVFEVLRGNAPPGVTAGTALRLLLERANTRFTKPIEHFETGYEGVCQDALTIFQQYGSEERISKIQGSGNTWEIERFSNANIAGAIDIVVEAGSAIPKSTVGEQALIQDLVAIGTINPLDPETQYKILEKFGSTNLLGSVDLNIRYAQRENWNFEHQDKEPMVLPFLDVHPVHVMVHKQYALTSGFEKLDENKRQTFMKHIMDHLMMVTLPPQQAGAPVAGESPTTPSADSGEPEGTTPPNGSPLSQQDTQQPPPMA